MELASQSVSATPSTVSQQLSSPLDLHSRYLRESAFRVSLLSVKSSGTARELPLLVDCPGATEYCLSVCLPSVERNTMSALN